MVICEVSSKKFLTCTRLFKILASLLDTSMIPHREETHYNDNVVDVPTEW